MDIFDRLAAPFPPHLIKWRKGGSGYLAYIDARHVMNRLDAVVGAHSWQDSYVETPSGRVICTLSILLPSLIDGVDQWVSKSDGAGDTSFEGEKGAISDALKRAAVKWGIGRYLYGFPVCKTEEEGVAVAREHWDKYIHDRCVEDNMDTLEQIRDLLADEDWHGAREVWNKVDQGVQRILWRAPTKGGWWTTLERECMKRFSELEDGRAHVVDGKLVIERTDR